LWRGTAQGFGVVNEAVEEGVGTVSPIDDGVPFCDGQLACDDGGAPAITVSEDVEQIVADMGAERLQASSRRG
jgi:hypothetical protein